MPESKKDTLISHLEELRKTLIKCFLAVCFILPFSFYFAPKILNLLIKRLIGNNIISLNYFSPMEVFVLQIKIALLLSLLIAFPYIAKRLWNFIIPGLYENERKFIKTTVFISALLFATGVIFCIFFILPLIINFGISFAGENINAMFGISNVINLALWLGFVFGLMFQIPLIVHMLIKYGIISYKTISSKRPYVIVCILIACALFTPPDIISQLLLFIPTYALFESGLLLSKLKTEKQQ